MHYAMADKEVKCLWENNYLVTFSGKNLEIFLKKHYPEMLFNMRRIDQDEEYVIDCYDMS